MLVSVGVAVHYFFVIAVIARVLLRDAMSPVVRLAWVTMIALVPVAGVLGYILFGEVRVRRVKKQRMQEVRRSLRLAAGADDAASMAEGISVPAFAVGRAVSGFRPLRGNTAQLLPEGDVALDDLVREIGIAEAHVHLLFYIWLPDETGTKMARAVMAAARRGVACRVLVDDLGSRALIRSPLWREMEAAGVVLGRAFPLGNPFINFIFQRIDVRNHRKIAVVDNRVTWVGSHNCADAAFLHKHRYAPWVDILMRVEGPVVRQMQAVFLQDWMTYNDEDLGHLLAVGRSADADGFLGQVVASGPDQSHASLSDMMAAMLFAAQRKVWVTTPYYVPDTVLHAALCSAAERGVETVLILPAKNDSRLIAVASQSLYEGLLRAGVRIMHFEEGLIHAKLITIDGQIALIGSANLDHRSFALNYENNLLLSSAEVTARLDARQQSYIDRSTPVMLNDVMAWSRLRRIRNNSVALANPLL